MGSDRAARFEGAIMRVLFANLKLLYQCRRLWPVYLFYGLMMRSGLSLVQLGEGASRVLVVTALYAAWIVGAIQEQVAAKPFSFCLPDHRSAARRLVFAVGGLISAIGGLYFALVYGWSDVSLGQFVQKLCLGLCFSGTLYLIGTALTLWLGSGLTMSVFIMVIVGSSYLFDGPRPGSDHIVLGHPSLVIALGVSTAIVVWRWLGRPAWFRRHCAKPVIGLLGTADLAESPSLAQERQHKQREVAAELVDQPWLCPAMDRRILSIIRAAEPVGLSKHFWGTAYTTLLPLFPLPPKLGKMAVLVPFLLLLILVAGYVPALAPAYILMLLLAAANGLEEGTPMFSAMLISGGRRERFYVTVAFVGLLAGLSAIVLMLPILVLNLLSPLLPNVEIGGASLTFHPISPWLPMLSMIVFPVVGLVSFGFHGRRVGGIFSWAIGCAALMLLIFHTHRIPEMPAAVIVLMAVVSWLAFALGIYRIAMRSDLGRR
jgi:hypothetical protein